MEKIRILKEKNLTSGPYTEKSKDISNSERLTNIAFSETQVK